MQPVEDPDPLLSGPPEQVISWVHVEFACRTRPSGSAPSRALVPHATAPRTKTNPHARYRPMDMYLPPANCTSPTAPRPRLRARDCTHSGRRKATCSRNYRDDVAEWVREDFTVSTRRARAASATACEGHEEASPAKSWETEERERHALQPAAVNTDIVGRPGVQGQTYGTQTSSEARSAFRAICVTRTERTRIPKRIPSTRPSLGGLPCFATGSTGASRILCAARRRSRTTRRCVLSSLTSSPSARVGYSTTESIETGNTERPTSDESTWRTIAPVAARGGDASTGRASARSANESSAHAPIARFRCHGSRARA